VAGELPAGGRGAPAADISLPFGTRDRRMLVATEPPERCVAFDRPVLAPGHGTVVPVHDAEPDLEARRSQRALVPCAMGQAGRLRRGAGLPAPDDSARSG
jgi:hypothetical protein